MLLGYRLNTFKQHLTADRINAAKLVEFTQFAINSTTPSSSFILLVSLNKDFVADFNCNDYYGLDACEFDVTWQRSSKWSKCMSFIDQFLVESDPAFLFFEDLPMTSDGFVSWISTLLPSTNLHEDGFTANGSINPQSEQWAQDFSQFCRQFKSLQIDMRSNAQSFSYKDVLLRSSAASSSAVAASNTTVVTQPVRQTRQPVRPQLVVTKTPYQRLDRQYGGNNEPMLDEDEYSDLIDSALRVKYQAGVTRYRAINRLPPKILEKKQERMLSKGSA